MSTVAEAAQVTFEQRYKAALLEIIDLRADRENATRVIAELQARVAALEAEWNEAMALAKKAIQRAEKAEAALERVARCLITPNPGIKDTIWLDPAPKSLGPTLYEFVCGVLGREVLP